MEIALFGGSFDPPHAGHLIAACYVLATEPSEELWLLPVFEHPLRKQLAAPFEHRVRLCERMLEDSGLARARVSRLEQELREGGPSAGSGSGFTVDLLEHLHRTRPGDTFALVLGSDLAAERPQWKRFERIEELARIVSLQRGGFILPGQPGLILPQVSSTNVRALLAAGGDARKLVPRAVLAEIERTGTYR